jgi:hypothetical protein
MVVALARHDTSLKGTSLPTDSDDGSDQDERNRDMDHTISQATL